jgi:hypothetical protein
VKRIKVQFPDPLYKRVIEVATLNDWALAHLVRHAVELYVESCPDSAEAAGSWSFPTLDLGGDFLVDPKEVRSEAISPRDKSQ